MRLLGKYIRGKFLKLFFMCLFSVILIFLIVDMVENMDKFIDKDVPRHVVALYYIYYLPYIIILIIPIASLLSVVFSVGVMARNNEIIALKSLGFSLYQLLKNLLWLGLAVALCSFLFAEVVAAHTTRKKIEIEKTYLSNKTNYRRIRNIDIQEPPDKMVTIGFYDVEKQTAFRVNIFTFDGYQLKSRLDVQRMKWEDPHWILENGIRRSFDGENENVEAVEAPIKSMFRFKPEDLSAVSIKPDEMGFLELIRFMQRVKESGGEVHMWLTDIHLRVSFPMSNIIIIMLSIPLVYNRRRKSIVTGFGISLAIAFLFFGVIKVGQTLGQKGSLPPVMAAWMGNWIMAVITGIGLWKTRK